MLFLDFPAMPVNFGCTEKILYVIRMQTVSPADVDFLCKFRQNLSGLIHLRKEKIYFATLLYEIYVLVIVGKYG